MSLSKWLPCDFEQCHPLLWSGGILVDHWSTISSYFRLKFDQPGTSDTCFGMNRTVHWCFTLWGLTHWGRDKMAAISQTTHSNPFSWMRIFDFRLTIFQHWFRWWLGADQATSHYLKQWWLDYRHIYASLGLNELIIHSWNKIGSNVRSLKFIQDATIQFM